MHIAWQFHKIYVDLSWYESLLFCLAAAWRRSPNLFLSFDDILGETGFQQKRRISSVCVCVSLVRLKRKAVSLYHYPLNTWASAAKRWEKKG